MKTIISVLIVFSAFAIANSNPITEDQYSNLEINSQEDAKVHFFVLMVPETSVQALRKKARQEEEGGAIVSETGVYVGQIISGVLGGDVRPIFAGSASFIDEPDVQQGVSTILANVAPSVNNILKQWVSRVQTALGIATTTTLRPGTLGNQTRPSNGVVVGRPISAAQASRLTPNQILQQQQIQQLQQQLQQYAPAQSIVYQPQTPQTVAPGSSVISGSDLFDTTTVEPLPLINLHKPSDEDEQEEAGSKKIKKAK